MLLPISKKIKYLLILTILSSMVVVMVFGPSAYRTYKNWRATQLSKKAMSLIDKNDYESAWLNAQKAYTLCPHNALVNKTVARIYEPVDPARALLFWEAAIQIKDNVPDRKSLINVALRANNLKAVQAQLAFFEKNKIEDAEILFAQSQYYYQENNIKKALESIQKCLTFDQYHPKASLLYATLCLESQTPESTQEGLAYLKKMIEDQNPYSLEALRMLSKYPELIDAQWVVDRLESTKDVTTKDKLLAISTAYKSHLIDQSQAISKAQNSLNLQEASQRVVFYQWLNTLGFYQDTLRFLNLEESLKRQDLFLIWVDAMAINQEWKTLESVFQNHEDSLPLDPYVLWMFKARIYKELNQEKRSNLAWNKAIILCHSHPQNLWNILNYALNMDDANKIRITFKALVDIPSFSLQAYTQWIQFEKSSQNTQKCLELLEYLSTLFPKNTSIENDIIYTELLLDKDLKDNLDKSIQLFEKEPEYLSHRMTLALAYLKNNDPKKALDTILNLPIDWMRVEPNYRALASIILKKNGYTKDASIMSEKIDTHTLMPQEKALLIP